MTLPQEVEPIKNTRDINKIRQYLYGKENKRDYCIFVVGINVGLRAGDLLSLKNGKDRIVPIHSKIFSLVQNKVQQNVKYLFEYNGKKLSTTQYYTFWNTVMKNLNMKHTPHECRHTFRSKLDSAGANKKCMDLLMGHKSKEVGERVYTHKTIQELRDALELFDKEEKAELITS